MCLLLMCAIDGASALASQEPKLRRPACVHRAASLDTGKMFMRFHEALSDATRLERGVLVVLALAAIGLLGFVHLAGEVMEGSTQGFDSRLLLMFRNPQDLSDPIGPRWFEEVMRDFTALDGTAVLSLLTLFVTVFRVLSGKRRPALLVAASIVLGAGIAGPRTARAERGPRRGRWPAK